MQNFKKGSEYLLFWTGIRKVSTNKLNIQSSSSYKNTKLTK